MFTPHTADGWDRFEGLAFPVVRVRYAGPTDSRGSRYVATVRGVRHTESYDDGLSASRNAHNAAAACWAKYCASLALSVPDDDTPRVFIPGDLDRTSYSFTVVDAAYLDNRRS